MTFNRIEILGNVGRDSETRATTTGKNVCEFSVATSERVRGEDKPQWYKVVTWDKLAELCKNVRKGDQVLVHGRLWQDTFTGKDGKERTALEITAERVYFLTRRTESNADVVMPTAVIPAAAKRAQTPMRDAAEDDGLPF